jgi:hypothetical protein
VWLLVLVLVSVLVFSVSLCIDRVQRSQRLIGQGVLVLLVWLLGLA